MENFVKVMFFVCALGIVGTIGGVGYVGYKYIPMLDAYITKQLQEGAK